MARRLALLAACAAGLIWPATAPAVTVTVGRATLDAGLGFHSCVSTDCSVRTLSQRVLGSPGTAIVPADGLLTVWRTYAVTCAGTIRVRVLRPGPGGLTGAGSGPPEQIFLMPRVLSVTLDPPLPVQTGDRIGVTAAIVPGGFCPSDARYVFVYRTLVDAAYYDVADSELADGGPSVAPAQVDVSEIMLNGDVVLDVPVVSAISPPSGPVAGGTEVTIGGAHLRGVTAVRFGDVPASSFAVTSNTEITAVAPPQAPGAVAVTVDGPGGTSAAGTARFTYSAPAPPADAAPVLGALRMRPSTFRAVRAATTISYTLSEAARTAFRVDRMRPGVRRGGRCVPPPLRVSSAARRCVRYVRLAGSFSHRGAAGANRLGYRGRLRGRTLRPGPYRLTAVAVDGAGGRSLARRTRFRIAP